MNKKDITEIHFVENPDGKVIRIIFFGKAPKATYSLNFLIPETAEQFKSYFNLNQKTALADKANNGIRKVVFKI